MRRASRYGRLFTWLLRLFPSEFRADFGDDMAADLRDRRREAARRGAVALFGFWLSTVADAVRRAPSEHLGIIRRDAGFAIRLLRRRPGFAASALLTLAIGIGLNTAVFSVVSGVLLAPLRLPDSDRLVRLSGITSTAPGVLDGVSSTDFLDWQAQSRTIESMALVGGSRSTIVGDGDPEQELAMLVTADFFRVAAVSPALGRLFSPADFAPLTAALAKDPFRGSLVRPDVVILGHDLWQRQFHGRDVVGTRVRLDGRSVEVVGVLPEGFAFSEVPGWGHAECWLPFAANPDQRRARYLNAIGRLAPGVSVPDAQAEFDVIGARLAAAYPADDGAWRVHVSSLRDSLTADVRTELWFLFGAAACVLFIACANVANLLLALASGRRRELTTRVALGATRGHLIRQTLTEGLLLGVLGGAGGVLLGWWTVPSLVRLAPPSVPRLNEVAFDGAALIFAAATIVAVGLGCGVAACLSLDRVNPRAAAASHRTSDLPRGRRFRRALTVAEIALALVLTVAAGLMVRTLQALASLDLGFDPSHVISIGLAPDSQRYRGRAGLAPFEAELVSRVKALPGVVEAGIGTRPLGGGGMSATIASDDITEPIRIGADAISPGYLEALGGRLLDGRFFTSADDASAPLVAIVNLSAARRLWPRGKAVGQFIGKGRDRLLVVGVVNDMRRNALEAEGGPSLYLSNQQPGAFTANNMLIRTERDPRQLLPAVRTVLRQLDPDQPLTRVTTLEEQLDASLAPRRFLLRLVGLFSALALALAMIGVYGVIAEWVAERVPEIGVRMALGASPRSVLGLVLRQGAIMTATGTVLGLAGAFAISRAMATLVFGVQTTDAVAYAVACASLIIVTIAACVIPARRAAAVDPVVALRQE